MAAISDRGSSLRASRLETSRSRLGGSIVLPYAHLVKSTGSSGYAEMYGGILSISISVLIYTMRLYARKGENMGNGCDFSIPIPIAIPTPNKYERLITDYVAGYELFWTSVINHQPLTINH